MILSARISPVASIDTIGADESYYSWGNKTDIITKGVKNTAVRQELNAWLMTNYYINGTNATQTDLANEIIWDIDSGHALGTSL